MEHIEQTKQSKISTSTISKMGVDLLHGPIDSTLRTFAIPMAFSFFSEYALFMDRYIFC